MADNFVYKKLEADDCTSDLLKDFNRYQKVTRCWRKENDERIIIDHAFIEDWDATQKIKETEKIKVSLADGGVALGAYFAGKLIGFTNVTGVSFGTKGQYLNLANLHVSKEFRGQGIGRALFQRACTAAAELGAKKLYISGHSAVETQAFYRSMGCVDAEEINPELFAIEPFDCHLEYNL